MGKRDLPSQKKINQWCLPPEKRKRKNAWTSSKTYEVTDGREPTPPAYVLTQVLEIVGPNVSWNLFDLSEAQNEARMSDNNNEQICQQLSTLMGENNRLKENLKERKN